MQLHVPLADRACLLAHPRTTLGRDPAMRGVFFPVTYSFTAGSAPCVRHVYRVPQGILARNMVCISTPLHIRIPDLRSTVLGSLYPPFIHIYAGRLQPRSHARADPFERYARMCYANSRGAVCRGPQCIASQDSRILRTRCADSLHLRSDDFERLGRRLREAGMREEHSLRALIGRLFRTCFGI